MAENNEIIVYYLPHMIHKLKWANFSLGYQYIS